jgi:hypothetical protein
VGIGVTDPEQVVIKMGRYALQLSDSNLLESKLRVLTEVLSFCKASKLTCELFLKALYSFTLTLSDMSRYSEAEIFARAMVAESDKESLIGEAHIMATQMLSKVILNRAKYEEARLLAPRWSGTVSPSGSRGRGNGAVDGDRIKGSRMA